MICGGAQLPPSPFNFCRLVWRGRVRHHSDIGEIGVTCSFGVAWTKDGINEHGATAAGGGKRQFMRQELRHGLAPQLQLPLQRSALDE